MYGEVRDDENEKLEVEQKSYSGDLWCVYYNL